MHDAIIVGAGSAGCVLAARLSEDRQRSLLLLDAGPDYGGSVEDWPSDLENANTLVTSHDWGYKSDPGFLGTPLRLFRGKVFGGSSATNNVIALRGQPSDYDAWAESGNPGWSFEEILPFFCKLEDDRDFSNPWHGKGGALTICRPTDAEMLPIQRAFLDSAQSAGHPWTEDHNAPGAIGIGLLPENKSNGVRESTALAYLAPVRRRPNLKIRANVLVDRIEFDGNRAVAVRLANSYEIISAKHIVLSAGVYGSPAILLRSGIGPKQRIRELGISVIRDLPGVGANLQDHPLLSLQYGTELQPQPPGGTIRQGLLTARSSSARSGLDLHIFPSGPTQGEHGACLKLLVGLMQPESRGQLSLAGSDPALPPRIDSALLSHPDDLTRLFAGMQMARDIAARAPLSEYLDEEQWPKSEIQNEDDLLNAIREPAAGPKLSSYQHGVGTCKMGPVDDPMSVVGPGGVIHGISGLSVIDASIMPLIPAANTNVPVIMLAERIASMRNTDRQ